MANASARRRIRQPSWVYFLLCLACACLLCASPVRAKEENTDPGGADKEDTAAAETPKPGTSAGQFRPPTPQVQDLGDGRYQIGNIVVDKPGRSFRVPGTVLHVDETLEYVAATKRAAKGYESLLELDADAFEFNLACILIGLDSDRSELPRYQFDTREAKGQPVELVLEWKGGPREEGHLMRAPVSELLTSDDEPVGDDDWVYLGSQIMDGAPPVYMAAHAGTLVGFVHDPASIIEHRTGIGIGAYGTIKGNKKRLPAVGRPVILTVAAKGDVGASDAD